MLQEKVESLLKDALEQRTDLFLIEMNVSENNSIKIVIDGDQGVSVEDCIFISRAVEHNLDREEEDFSLEVSSAGATSALVNERQYKKNQGRLLKVITLKGTFEGTLTQTLPEGIVLDWKAREPKPIGKGKVTVNKQATIAFGDIKEAKVMIKL